MMVVLLHSIFERDLNKLYQEIESYRDELNIWKTEKHIANSGGNLCLHLVGNLNTYIGKEIGNTGYVRNREEEFSLKAISKKQLLMLIGNTRDMINKVLIQLTDEFLENEYPVLVFEKKTSTGYLLVHLATHLAYHTGQINYHRRLFDE